MRDKTVALMVLATLIGMIGLYYLLYRGYQLYQEKSASISANPLGSLLGALAGGHQ